MAIQQEVATNSVADRAIAFALAQVGKPYVWGATGPDSYDCSGLIQTSYKHAGLKLTRTTYTQVKEGISVTRADIQPGDLNFPNPGHVQLYIGNGKIVEAPTTGIPVRVMPIGESWQVRRVTAPGSPSGVAAAPFASNPVDSALGLDGLSNAVSWITTAHNWLRIAEFVAGLITIFVAIQSLTKGA